MHILKITHGPKKILQKMNVFEANEIESTTYKKFWGVFRAVF